MATETRDVSQFLDSGTLPQQTVARRRMAMAMVAGVAIVLAVAGFAGSLLLNDREQDLLAGLELRLNTLAAGREELIKTRIQGLAQIPSHLVSSDSFRLFATEVDATAADDPLAAQLSDMGPYWAEALSEIVRQNGLVAAYMIGRSGQTLLASGAAPELTDAQRQRAVPIFETSATVVSPIRQHDGELEIDLYRPILTVQTLDPGATPPPVGVFMITLPVTGLLADFVAPRPLSEPGEATYVVQETEDGAVAVSPDAPGDLVAVAAAPIAWPLDFAERQSVVGPRRVFSVSVPVADTTWHVVQEVDHLIATAALQRVRLVLILVTVLAALVIAVTLVAVWYNQSSHYNRALARQFRDLANRIDAQRRLLDGINGAIREFIGLKRPDGTYAYVNPAFAEAVGRPMDQIVGQTDEAVFGHGQAQRLEQTDRQAISTGLAISAEEQLYLGGVRRFLAISKVPLRRADDEVDGIVSVARDVTELVEERRKREAALRHTIDALVRTIELSDPYLAGHSKLVSRLSCLMAQRLALPPEDVATVETAANLAQIGKLFVPREILTKPDRLTPDEIKIMEQHVDHAASVLRDIDFGLPVRETIYQMYERLDGSGYPRKLAGDHIMVTARVLGLADVFCARIRPRSYRGALAPSEALSVMRQFTTAKFGEAVMDALGDVLNTAEGEKLAAAAHGQDSV